MRHLSPVRTADFHCPVEDLLDPPQAELQRPHPAEKAAERVSDEFHVGVDGGLRIDGTNL